MFVLGCPELIVATDYKPLFGIFTNQDLSNISTHIYVLSKKKLFVTNLKESTVWENGSEVLM